MVSERLLEESDTRDGAWRIKVRESSSSEVKTYHALDTVVGTEVITVMSK